jgi:sulfite reductase beta subunit-like hemoprotein
MGDRLTEVTEGDDETVFYMLLDFAGMTEEFPAADLDPLGYAAVLDAAEAHASVERAERRSGGRSRTHYRILARDVEEFREKLASALRPLCRKLASPS